MLYVEILKYCEFVNYAYYWKLCKELAPYIV